MLAADAALPPAVAAPCLWLPCLWLPCLWLPCLWLPCLWLPCLWLPCLWLRLWWLRGSLDLTLRLWRLLLTLRRPLLWLPRLWLPRLRMGCRPSLLRRFIRGRRPRNVCASGLRRLRARCRASGLLVGWWRAGSALALLRGTCLRRRCLPYRRRRYGRTLHPLRLKLLPHDSVARLVTVVLALEDLLLRRLRISIP
ncbi:MAG: hypothetical protein ACYC9Z_15175 [Casimicrobiaceae bacterium]